MIAQFIIAGTAFLGMFVLFLVLSKTLNNILNQLMKLEYVLHKELDLQNEVVAIKKLLNDKEQNVENGNESAAAETAIK